MQDIDAQVERLKDLRGEELLESIYRISQQYGGRGDPDSRAEWLKNLLRASWKEGTFAWDLKAFGELRQMYQSSDRFAYLLKDLLWYFKWVVGRVSHYADVPLATCEALFAEMADFYAAAEESPRPIYSHKCRFLVEVGDLEGSKVWYERWQATRTGTSDDCPACESATAIEYHLAHGDKEAVFKAADGILEGKEWCDETPATLSVLMVPALQTGRGELAMQMQRFSERYVRKTPNVLRALACHVTVLSLVGELSRAGRLAKIGLSRANRSDNDLDKFSMYRAAGLWLSLEAIDRRREHVRLPRSVVEGQVSVPEAAGRMFEQARLHAGRLDARNGNGAYTERVANSERWIADLIEQQKQDDAASTSPDNADEAGGEPASGEN